MARDVIIHDYDEIGTLLTNEVYLRQISPCLYCRTPDLGQDNIHTEERVQIEDEEDNGSEYNSYDEEDDNVETEYENLDENTTENQPAPKLTKHIEIQWNVIIPSMVPMSMIQ